MLASCRQHWPEDVSVCWEMRHAFALMLAKCWAVEYLNGDLGRNEATLWSMHEVDILHNVGHRIDMDNLGLRSTATINPLGMIMPLPTLQEVLPSVLHPPCPRQKQMPSLS